MVGMLGDSGLASDRSMVIVEKLFGTDLASARVLNQALHAVSDESQVVRIDHFLGKESVDIIADGRDVDPEDVATLSPLITHTIRRFGDWHLDLTPARDRRRWPARPSR